MIKLKDVEIIDFDIVKVDKEVTDEYDDFRFELKQTNIAFCFNDGTKNLYSLEDEYVVNLTSGDLYNYFTNTDLSECTKEQFLNLFSDVARELFYKGLLKENPKKYKYCTIESFGKFLFELSENIDYLFISGRKQDQDIVEQFVKDNIQCDSYNIEWRNGKFEVELFFNNLSETDEYYFKRDKLTKELKEKLKESK